MTSVPNRRLPLNGNNPRVTQVFFLLLVLLLSGCELFKPISNGQDRPERTDDRVEQIETEGELDPIQSRRVYDPETGTYVFVQNAPTDKMDTVQWRLISEFDVKPITEDGTDVYAPVINTPDNPDTDSGTFNKIEQSGTTTNGSRLLTAYNVNYVLPFLANRLGQQMENSTPVIDPNSLWALHFYSGAQMALDKLRENDVKLNVTAQDTRATADRVNTLQNSSEVRAAHVMIGPYLRNNVSLLAEQVKGKEQVLISPYSAAGGISNDNPNYIQVNPTLEVHCRNILNHAYRTQNTDQIVLVAGPTQVNRFAVFQEQYKILRNDVNAPPLPELVITENTVNLSAYSTGRSVVFLVPIYEDEAFVSNFLRQTYQLTRSGDTRVTVYGLPQWKSFSQVDADYLEGNNVHISSSVFVDRLDPAVQEFRKDFYDRFQTLPREEAFVGYDLTYYFLRMLNDYGTRFQYELPRNPEKLMHTELRFEPILVPQEGRNDFENARVDHWVNTFVNILRYRDYQYKKVN